MPKAIKTNRSSLNSCYTKSYKRWTAFSWFLFGMILFASLGYATTISENQLTSGNIQLNLTANGDSAIMNLRTTGDEDGDTQIVFWDSATNTSAIRRLGQLNWHGDDTSVGTNEIAWYMVDGSGTMQNQWKMVGQENYTGNNYLILTGSAGISRTNGNQIDLGKGVLGGNNSAIKTNGDLKIGTSITDGTGVENEVNISVFTLKLNSGMENGDTVISFFNQGTTSFDTFYLDKASYPGLGGTGFRSSTNLHIDSNLTIAGSGLLKLIANTTALTCGSSQAGSIYYDGSTKKHYGCNSTTWNALY